MYYYEVKSNLVGLFDKDAYVSSEKELSAFDLLVVDTEEHGFVACTIAKEISQFDAISMPFDIGSYLMKMNMEAHLKKKKVKSKSDTILKKVEAKVKEIQYLDKLKKYSNDPKVQALLEEYYAVNSDKYLEEAKQEINTYDEMDIVMKTSPYTL